MATQRNHFYLYDLPKDKVSSVKIAEAFKANGIDIVGNRKPQFNRTAQLFRPFYSSIIEISNPEHFKLAKEKMKYFEIDGCMCRGLPIDPMLKGDNRKKINDHNVFFKLPKEADKNQLTYMFLHENFEKYGPIKSAKISINQDYTPRGFAFVCFEKEEDAAKCLADMGKSHAIQQWKPRDTQAKIVNNLYFKNIPPTMKEEDVRKMFEKYGQIKSLSLMDKEVEKNGQKVVRRFGFVCYEDKDGKNTNHGTDACQRAVEELTDKDVGQGEKLYIRNFLNKQQREQEKFVETIKYKTSKKRCNLYVKNFPADWDEKALENLFKTYGEIEKIKLEKGFQNNTFAFICFKKPDACSQAKNALQGQTYDGKSLIINHYEIKEIRELQLEEMRDKRDWERYVAQQQGGLQWHHLSSQPNLSHIIQQLLQLIQQQQVTGGGDQRKSAPRPMGQKPQQPRMNYNQQRPQAPRMPNAPQGMPQQPQQMYNQQPMMQQQQTPQMRYVQDAQRLLPSVQERNNNLKDQVGHLIYDYVTMLVGAKDSPKITGMLIELPINQIRHYLSSFEALQMRVEEARTLLNSTRPDGTPQ